MRRILDVVCAGSGLVFLLPLLAAIAIAIRVTSPGPVLFRQVRVGLHGRRFRIFKFRTMVADAEARGLRFTVGGDVRVTPVGAFLRRHKLDELPQLLNVLAGDMALVGPRPEVPEYVEQFREQFAPVLTVRPGITHRASLLFSNEEQLLARANDPERYYLEHVMPRKLSLYRRDLARASVRNDIRTILATVRRVALEVGPGRVAASSDPAPGEPLRRREHALPRAAAAIEH